MLLTLLLSTALFQEITPTGASWTELRKIFPERWEFPQTDASGASLPSHTFEDRLRELAAAPLIGEPGAEALYLGDLIRTAVSLGWEPKAMRTLLDGYAPLLTKERIEILEDLLLSDRIRARDWVPSDDTRDGIHFGPTWELPEDYWIAHDGSRSVEQAATLIMADLAAIKRAEHDFPSYFRFPENAYLQVDPRPASFVRCGEEGQQRCMAAALDVRFRSDLPFPFTTYSLDLGILHRVRSSEELITYVFGRGEDVHWLAGYDRFWTIRDRSGKPVATLLVRQLALDIAGVPDKSKHRREGIRSGIGNLKRGSERIFRGVWKVASGEDRSVPEFPVIAPKAVR